VNGPSRTRRRFSEAGIAAVPYKGPILAALLYHDVGLREFSDIDVLVKPEEVPRAREMLLASGYEPEFALSPSQERKLLASRAGYFLRFDRVKRAGRIVLELHWRIPASFSLDDSFWDRLRPARLLDAEVHHFSPEDLLLILCMHGFKHGWSHLKWLCDVHELLHDASLDCEQAIERAKRAGGLRIVLVGCALARTLLDAPLPPLIDAQIQKDGVARSLAETFRRRNERPRPYVGLVNNLKIRENLGDKIRFGVGLLSQLTVPEPAERVTLPQWPGAGVVYGVSRPFRVVSRSWMAHRRRQVHG
jgi:hypothetical protein